MNHFSSQVGISRHLIQKFVNEWIVRIDDLSPSVEKIRQMLKSGTEKNVERLLPIERVYPIDTKRLPWDFARSFVRSGMWVFFLTDTAFFSRQSNEPANGKDPMANLVSRAVRIDGLVGCCRRNWVATQLARSIRTRRSWSGVGRVRFFHCSGKLLGIG
ncbi:MAG: DUF4291 family protein [Planctomycetaceae bacterium]|nr:DUF4291 family protein [Planctomycetaceae bacterium]